ncbi:protein of unknown function [Brevefilum fermentans]|uniref:Uncharacterized protein n=1 Tax=Candidatus Brevifilum fermentans TaxID=1986204 RepID=A0A1Y6K3I7_9CHLR|nr:protein of unknown function [Brevefilum fermentans]
MVQEQHETWVENEKGKKGVEQLSRKSPS